MSSSWCLEKSVRVCCRHGLLEPIKKHMDQTEGTNDADVSEVGKGHDNVNGPALRTRMCSTPMG